MTITLTNVATGHFYSLGAVHIGEESEAEAFRVGGVTEAIDSQGGLRGVEGFAHTSVEFIIGDAAPERRLRVSDRLRIG
jgi:hypothetical protein